MVLEHSVFMIICSFPPLSNPVLSSFTCGRRFGFRHPSCVGQDVHRVSCFGLETFKRRRRVLVTIDQCFQRVPIRSQARKKPGDLTHARCFSFGFWALCVRNSSAELTTIELGKHRVAPTHPLKPLFCAHTMIFRLNIWKSEQQDVS